MKLSELFHPVITSLFVTLLAVNGLSGQNGIVILDEGNNNIAIKNNSYSGFTLEQSLNEFRYIDVDTEKGHFTKIIIPGYSSSVTTGSPDLPVVRKLIEVPENAQVHVDIQFSDIKEYYLPDYNIVFPVMPVQPPYPKSDQLPPPFAYNSDVYKTNAFFHNELISVDDLGYMRGVRIARINVSPFEYNPVSRMIRVYTGLKVDFIFENADIEKTKKIKELNASPFFEAANRKLINYKALDTRDTITKYPVTYLIVSDPAFQEQLQPFVEWKTMKGFNVIEAYTNDPQVGNTTSSIKAYIEALYNSGTPGNPAPSFVLFVGDIGQVPAFTASYAASDMPYCEFTGDYFPEIYFGRMSANNPSQLQPQIDKTLQYEKYTMPDPSYLSEVVLVAGMDGSFAQDWGNGQINYGTENYFNTAHGITAHVYLYPESGSSSSQIIQHVSDGVGFGNYTAHCSSSGWGDPSFTTYDVPGLENENKYGLLIGNCCQSNAFDSNECFGEALLRAENKGCIGYIGGSNNTMWDEDYYFGVGVGLINEDPPPYEETTMGAYDGMFHDHGEPFESWYITQYQIIYLGNMAVTEGAPGSAQYYWDIYCVMGDPSLMPYLAVPQEMTVTYDPLMPLASSSFTVYAEPYSYVAVSKDGILHGAAVADENGEAVVTLDPITVPGEAHVVVTGQNLQPYIGTVVVASPDGPYVLFDQLNINDSYGNNNSQADYGEEIMLDITLENVGNADASNLYVTLSSDDENISIENNTSVWPDITSGDTSTILSAFTVNIQELIPDEHKVSFELEITDGNDTWYSGFPVHIFAPVLQIGNLWIDDSYAGNDNGVADPGEMVDIHISGMNKGHCETGEVMSYLVCDNEHITLYNNEMSMGVLGSDEIAESVFTLVIDPEMPVGHTADMEYQMVAGAYEKSKLFSVKTGLIIEDFESGDFNAFDWYFEGDNDWTISESDFFSGSYSAQSGEIDDLETTSLVIEFDVLSDDSISFYRKVSSEASYDYLRFYIDDELIAQWAGEKNWERVAFPVSAGIHAFKWEYYKDVYVSNGEDRAWIDYIVFPSMDSPGMPFTLDARVYPENLCYGDEAYLLAVPQGGSGNYSYQWSPGNTLNDPAIFNPVASPLESTMYSVEVTDGIDTLTAEIMLHVVSVPAAPVISQSEEMLVSNYEQGNQWYFWGIPLPDATGQTFMPTATGEYYATVTSEYGCESDPSNIIYYIYTSVEEKTRELLLDIYPNPASNLVTINLSQAEGKNYRLDIVNALGQPVITQDNPSANNSGSLSYTVDIQRLEPGIYYCRVTGDDASVVKKIIITK